MPVDPDPRDVEVRFAAELAARRDALTVQQEVGLALREDRRRRGLSQRAYAKVRGLSHAMLARLEMGDDRTSLATVVSALSGTGFTLVVARDPAPGGPDEPAPSMPVAAGTATTRSLDSVTARVDPTEWEATDLLATVRGGWRRFPAHRRVYFGLNPPTWWYMHEFFEGRGPAPEWYAPVLPLPSRQPPATRTPSAETA